MELSKYEFLKEAFELEDIQSKLASYPGKTKLTSEEILSVISKHEYSISREMSVAAATVDKICKFVWPDKPTKTKLDSFYFRKYGVKYCSHCREIKDITAFSLNASRLDGLNSHCKKCYTETTRDYQREYQATRDASQVQRTPKWANLDKIKEIYKQCPKGYHVDHIIPLKGDLVSGLHVESNLQYLTAEDNIKKNNKFSIE